MIDHAPEDTSNSSKTTRLWWPLLVIVVVAVGYGWLVVRSPSARGRRESIARCRQKYDAARTYAETLRVDDFGGGRRWNTPYSRCGDYRLTGMR